MDSFEWNKIVGAVLGTALFVMVLRIGGEALFDVPPPAKPGYIVEGVVETANASTGTAPVEESIPDFATVIPTADVSAGQQIAVRCAQCHDWTKGGPNKIGPNLFGIIGRGRASHPGFSYSSAMQKKGGNWSYEDLFRYIHQPAKFVPGNKMAFAGIPKPQDRINLLAFMRTWADSPPALPPHKATPAPAPATPAATPTATPAPAQPAPAAPPHH